VGLPGTVSNMLERVFLGGRGGRWRFGDRWSDGDGGVAQLNVQPEMATNEANSLLQ